MSRIKDTQIKLNYSGLSQLDKSLPPTNLSAKDIVTAENSRSDMCHLHETSSSALFSAGHLSKYWPSDNTASLRSSDGNR